MEQPDDVGIVGRNRELVTRIGRNMRVALRRHGPSPSVNFGVAIREAERGRVPVVVGGQFRPARPTWVQRIQSLVPYVEHVVVEGIGPFVQEDKEAGWRGHFAQFEKDPVRVGEVYPMRRHVIVHADASDDRDSLSGKYGCSPVIRAFVNLNVSREMRAEKSVPKIGGVGIVRPIRHPQLDVAPDPLELWRQVLWSVIQRYASIVIVGIHDPGQGHLLHVVQTVDSLRLGFGFTKSG